MDEVNTKLEKLYEELQDECVKQTEMEENQKYQKKYNDV